MANIPNINYKCYVYVHILLQYMYTYIYEEHFLI